MENYKSIRLPLFTSTNLDKHEEGSTIDENHYRGMIESLLYLTTSRPDILFVVCLYAQFQSNPKASHAIAIKRIIRYLKGTENFGI